MCSGSEKKGLIQVCADRWNHVGGNLRAAWRMVIMLFSVGLCCSLVSSSVCQRACAQRGEAQKRKAWTQTSRKSEFMIDLSAKPFVKLVRSMPCKRVWVCAKKCTRQSCVADVCVFLAVHVQEAGRWNQSTANYPNTINQNRCFSMSNAVTWRPDACQAISSLPCR